MGPSSGSFIRRERSGRWMESFCRPLFTFALGSFSECEPVPPSLFFAEELCRFSHRSLIDWLGSVSDCAAAKSPDNFAVCDERHPARGCSHISKCTIRI